MPELTVRNAGPGDYARIVAIYNHYVLNTAATFDLRPFSVGERAPWFGGFGDDGPYQLLVATATASSGHVLGYAYSSRFNPRPAYDISVETTVYVDPEHVAGGIGSALYRELFARLANGALHGAYAGITLPNEASIRLHEKFGFHCIGVETEVGYKFDRYWSVGRYERRL
ncbi:MAG: GNAT family N-acetyltransferase [Woeseiaceae bacterium]|nr:GNAT family N-acetyltransferase [Woeseiaceae bacterium]